MARQTWEERRKNKREIKELLQGAGNKSWYYKRWRNQAWAYIGVFIALWQIPGLVGIQWPQKIVLPVFVIVTLIIILVTRNFSRKAIKDYLHKKVETVRPGCTVEIRVADSYLTNAFRNYPKAAMMIGINKAFWFQEAEPGSLVADMWKPLKDRGIDKEEVQRMIDEALQKIKEKEAREIAEGTRNPEDVSIDRSRPYVQVKRTPKEEEGPDAKDYVLRDNFKIGTIVGVDLCWQDQERKEVVPFYKLIPEAFVSSHRYFKFKVSKLMNRILLGKNAEVLTTEEKRFWDYIKAKRIKTIPAKRNLRKFYLIANSEVVQGKDTEEPMKVTSDKHAPVTNNFEKIWEYFETEEKLTEYPPQHCLYSPLLVPLIGAGVANEGYNDLQIFSQLIDLYYKHLRKSIRMGVSPAIPQLIINIRNKTAIEIDPKQQSEDRKIDIETAFWYLDYRNQVSPPENAE